MNKPIGILDSGLGGLTIWKEIVALLPHESTIYIADSQYAPYGMLSSEEIYKLSKRLIDFLIAKEAKVIVIACNTITVSCLDRLRTDYPGMAIIGTVPVVKTAAEVTQNNRIGVLSTTYTANSSYQKNLIEKFAGNCLFFNHGTDALVSFVERGELSGDKLEQTLSEVLLQFKQEKIDTLALGCTHFPFLRKQMQKILGEKVTILDSGPAIARQVKRVLENKKSETKTESHTYSFFTTGNTQVAKKLLAGTIANREYEFIKVRE